MDLKLELTCDRTMLAVRQISVLVRAILSEIVTQHCVNLVEIAATELCTNAVEHVPPGGEDLPLRVELELRGDSLRVDLVEQSGPFDPREFERPNLDSGDRRTLPTAGMGLSLIHDTMDDIRYKAEGGVSTVTLVKRVRRLKGAGAPRRRTSAR